MNVSWLQKRWLLITLHIAFWLLLFSLPWLLRPSHDNQSVHDKAMDVAFFYQYFVNCVTWVGLFYVNSFFLIPVYISRKKYVRYVVVLLLLLSVALLINGISFATFIPNHPYSFKGAIAFYLLPTIFILSISTTVTMFQQKFEADKLQQQKENENLKTELAFLRSQVSPHFLFNVLNNMVVLARKQSDQLEPSLFKLSSLLRYTLYESDEEKVLLEKEVEYLNSYIDLQLQRFASKVSVNTKFDELPAGIMIEPMLLIPFVENAFKHGTGFKQKGVIDIELKASNKMVEFRVSNYFDAAVQQVKDRTSGIGLQNVRRRLNLLYKNKHSLTINDKDNLYTVILQINLN